MDETENADKTKDLPVTERKFDIPEDWPHITHEDICHCISDILKHSITILEEMETLRFAMELMALGNVSKAKSIISLETRITELESKIGKIVKGN